jgi:hypothetical protein
MGHWQATMSPWLDLYDKAGPETEEQRGLAEDKAHVKRMAPVWKAEAAARLAKKAQAAAAERERVARLFEAEDDRVDKFPTPAEVIRKSRSTTT